MLAVQTERLTLRAVERGDLDAWAELKELNADYGTIDVQITLGRLKRRTGREREAGGHWAEALTVSQRLGDVPVAVLEKGKQPGSHLLSGAVVNPRALHRLFGERLRMEDLPSFGPVPGESVYVLTRRGALPIPPPPPRGSATSRPPRTGR